MVHVVRVVRLVVLWKRGHRPTLPRHESARAKNSPGNQNIVVSFVKKPQNKAGGRSFAICVIARERDQNDDT